MSKLNLRAAVAAFALLAAPAALLVPMSGSAADSPEAVTVVPDPATDAPLASQHGTSKAVLAGGCFWGVQAVFQHVRGVTHVTSGYSGGSAITAQYELVGTGTTGHAESVEITYDPAVISYGKLLKVYFEIAHNPTELNHQGPDDGTQYRSNIFFADPEQQKIATAYIAQLDAAKVYGKPIVTQVTPLKGFFAAEGYHQNYATLHPDDRYIAYWDLPKVANLQKEMPDLYVAPVTN